MPDTCENCGKVIGDQDTPHLYKNHIVCDECIKKLSARQGTKAKQEPGSSPSAKASSKPIAKPKPIQPPPPPSDEPASIDDLLSGDDFLEASDQPAAPAMAPMRPMQQMAPMMAPPMMAAQPMMGAPRGLRPVAPSGPKSLNVSGLIGLILVCLSIITFCIPFMSIVGLAGFALAITGLVLAKRRNEGKALCWTAIGLGVIPLCLFTLFFIVAPIFGSKMIEVIAKMNDDKNAQIRDEIEKQHQSQAEDSGNSSVLSPAPTPAIPNMPTSLQNILSSGDRYGVGSVSNKDLEIKLVSYKVVDRLDPDVARFVGTSGPVLEVTLQAKNISRDNRYLGFLNLQSRAILYTANQKNTGIYNATSGQGMPPASAEEIKLYFPPIRSIGSEDMAIWMPAKSLDTTNNMILQIPAGYKVSALVNPTTPSSTNDLSSPREVITTLPKRPEMPSIPESLAQSSYHPNQIRGLGTISADGITLALRSIEVLERSDPSVPETLQGSGPVMAFNLRYSVPPTTTARKALRSRGGRARLLWNKSANLALTLRGETSDNVPVKRGEFLDFTIYFNKPDETDVDMALEVSSAHLFTEDEFVILIPRGFKPDPTATPNQAPANDTAMGRIQTLLSRWQYSSTHYDIASVTANDLKISLAELKRLPADDPAIPPKLRNNRPWLRARVRVTVLPTSPGPRAFGNIGNRLMLYSGNSQEWSTTDMDKANVSFTLDPGASAEVDYFFRDRDISYLDMAFLLPGQVMKETDDFVMVLPAGYTLPKLPPVVLQYSSQSHASPAQRP